jgi:hypothetical protein
MSTIQWRPEVNALTTPQSWRPRHIPRAIFGNDDLAAKIAQRNPLYTEGMGRGFLQEMAEVLREELINGNQWTLEGLLTCHLSLTGRMDAPDDPLPPLEDCLQVKIYPSKRLVEDVRKEAQLERLPVSKKLPLISKAEDTVLKLNDVLNPNGGLHLVGSDLLFDQEDEGCGCVLEGTRSGRKVQSRYTLIANSEITILPDIPAQNDPWNNEYILSLNTQYTENGTLRTGIYERRLRTPLTLTNFGHPNPPDVGILTDKAATPHVTITGGALSADETVRIQVILDLHDSSLSFNLLDMTEGGKAGAVVKITANGPITLSGFSDSALSSLNLTVNNYADLVKMIRSNYSGRLVDVLMMKVA